MGDRTAREQATVRRMIGLYCRGHHRPTDSLCPSCRELAAYAWERTTRCPFGTRKPTCARCTVHCYAPDRREQIRAVMQYAGPRMVWHHPWLTFRHLLDRRNRPSSP